MNQAIRTTALLVYEGQITIGTVEIKDDQTDAKLKIKSDGVDNAVVVTQNGQPLPDGAATEAKQDGLLAKDFATQATLDAVLAKLAEVGLDPATIAALAAVSVTNFPADYPDAAVLAKLNQLLGLGPAKDSSLASILAKLAEVGLHQTTVDALKEVSVTNLPADYPDAAVAGKLDQLLGKDFATQATLAAVLAKLTDVGLDAATLAALEVVSVGNFPADYPDGGTQARLDLLNAREFATETTLAAILAKLIAAPATEAKQDTGVGLLGGGDREHRELAGVSTVYDPGLNSITFSSPRKHFRVFVEEDMYWVDSAADDTDAETKLTTAGSRGFITRGDRFESSLQIGITRLDFLARDTAGPVFITGLI